MSEDIRVLLVKLADRLHNMRTLHFIKSSEKRQRIAMETMDIFAPLADRIGMQEMKQELEDLAFAEINGDARQSILKRLDFLRTKGEDLIDNIITELQGLMADNGVQASISGREKTPYSIWKKMQKNEVGFEQLSDIMAFRVIVDSVEDCYKTLGIAHNAYPVVPFPVQGLHLNAETERLPFLHTGVLGQNGIGSSCRSELRRCMTSRSEALQPTGTTNKGSQLRMARNIAGCANFWISLNTPLNQRSFWNIPSWRCSKTKYSALPTWRPNQPTTRRDTRGFCLCSPFRGGRPLRRVEDKWPYHAAP